MSIQKFRESFAVSGAVKLIVAGDYFRLGTTSYAVTVRFYRGSAINSEMANIDGGTWTKIDGGFDAVEVINSASGAQILDIFIGSGEVGIDRIIGEVSVISGELSRVKSGVCFLGQTSTTAGAGQYPEIQLFNPAGSGKNMVLNRLVSFCSVAGLMGLVKTTVQLANLGTTSANKSLGGASPVGQLRSESGAALVAGTIVSMVSAGAAYDSKEFVFSEPIYIPPGNGVFVYANSFAVYLGCSFQWFEETI